MAQPRPTRRVLALLVWLAAPTILVLAALAAIGQLDPGAAAIAALAALLLTLIPLRSLGRDLVALAEQFRPGAYAAGWEPWQVEIVAGIVDEGETREAAALREAREEAGTEVAEMIPMLDLIASPGGASETLRVFLARVDAARIAGHHGLEHEAEDIRIHKISAAEALAWTEQGRIRNAVSVAAIQWLALHKEEVRKRWGAI